MEDIFLLPGGDYMNILSVSKLQKEFDGDILFHRVSFDINSKDKIAIIGNNGTGKSTLLKMIQGDIAIDEGVIHTNNKATIGYLSQDVIEATDNTLEEEMLHVFQSLLDLERKIQTVTSQLNEYPHNEELLDLYSRLEHNYSVQGGYHYHTEVNMILSQFGFTLEDFNRQIKTFSGGEKTRVAFAKLLLSKPDLLILDEPTNHLDITIIDWLEDYLNKYEGAVLLVTHDKYFISKVCRTIIELDHGTSHVYHGTFQEYEVEKIARYEQLLKQYNKQQKEIQHLQSFIDRFRYNAKRASLAKDRQKKLDRIKRIDKPHVTKRRVHLDFSSKRPTKEIIMQAKDLSIGYDKALIKDASFTMRGFDKLAIVGPNGVGKTTLLRVLERKMKPLYGSIEFLRSFHIGYFDQNQESLHYHKTVFEEIHDAHPMFTNYDVRSVAARFLFFNEDLDKSISILSGGEKVRLVLLMLMLEQPDLLILDEPTNHLDIETKDIVEDVLSQFDGPIIFVSHDRYFINRVATKLLYLSHGTVKEYDGSYDAFKLSQQIAVHSKETTKSTTKSTKNYKKIISEIEQTIHRMEQTINEKKQLTFQQEIYEDYRKIHQLHDEIDELEKALHAHEEKYYKLLTEMERKEV